MTKRQILFYRVAPLLALAGCGSQVSADSNAAHASDPEAIELATNYRACLEQQAAALDDRVQPVETIANAAEARCFETWSTLSIRMRQKAREIVVAAPGDPAVAQQMITGFDEELVRIKAMIRDEAVAAILERRASDRKGQP